MKVNKETKKAVAIIVAIGAVCVAASFLSSCDFKGPEGPSGGTGPTGLQGNPGPVGSPGPQGAPGENCTVTYVSASDVAPNGGSLIACPDGSQSLVLNGTNGSNGSPGTPGTVVTPIQFCPGTGSYPSTFPEVGFCINNSIWAVYSENGGFLTEVLPGTWNSNGINNSCTFIVEEGCVVSN